MCKVMETRFIEHLVAYRSEYDELRDYVREFGWKELLYLNSWTSTLTLTCLTSTILYQKTNDWNKI